MAKVIVDAVLDLPCAAIAECTEMYICSAEPTDRANAISLALASRTGMTGSNYTGPANGSVSGRRVTKNAESGMSISANGTANHVALCTGSVLRAVTTCAAQALSSGGTVSTSAFDAEFRDPT